MEISISTMNSLIETKEVQEAWEISLKTLGRLSQEGRLKVGLENSLVKFYWICLKLIFKQNDFNEREVAGCKRIIDDLNSIANQTNSEEAYNTLIWSASILSDEWKCKDLQIYIFDSIITKLQFNKTLNPLFIEASASYANLMIESKDFGKANKIIENAFPFCEAGSD